MKHDKQVTLAITGASGAPYALTLLKSLVNADYQVYVLISSAAKVVFATEENVKIPGRPEDAAAFFTEHCNAKPDQIKVFGKEEWFSPVASGSAAPAKMVVCPCSTGTLSAISIGASDNLIERAADVVLKERGQLILVPREMPLSSIILENMLKLSRNNCIIAPPIIGYYSNPKTIEDLEKFLIGKYFDMLGIEHSLFKRWGV